MSEPWTPFCRKKWDYEHTVHYHKDISYPYYDMANPQLLDWSSLSHEVILIESSSPAHQNSSTPQFPQLDKFSEIARQQSIHQTQQKKHEQPHAGSIALSTHPKLPILPQSQLISQSFTVNIYVYTGVLYDVELYLCSEWTSICKCSIVILIVIYSY